MAERARLQLGGLRPLLAVGIFAAAIALLHRELADYTYRGVMARSRPSVSGGLSGRRC